MKNYEVIIVGAGPGGLGCGRILAEAGVRVLIIERKRKIGPKVCGGGVTWDGLINRVPEELIEKSFRKQYIFSDRQQITVVEKNPIVATISRGALGKFMTEQACDAGAEVWTETRAAAIEPSRLTVVRKNGRSEKIGYNHLVGADGSSSAVRKFIMLPVRKVGLGINYQLPVQAERMEWHLNSRLFGTGYGWIFPHRDTVSIGVYGERGAISPQTLKRHLIDWARSRGFGLNHAHGGAALINYDFRGIRFDNVWLVGDAAGLASGLTGEGIYPAIVSGETVARLIIDQTYETDKLKHIIKKQRQHHLVLRLASTSNLFCSLIMEGLVMALRLKLLDFRRLEMAD